MINSLPQWAVWGLNTSEITNLKSESYAMAMSKVKVEATILVITAIVLPQVFAAVAPWVALGFLEERR